MTGHFTTFDGCERWIHITTPVTEYYRVPYSYPTPISDVPMPSSTTYAYRTYKLERIEPLRGLVHYVEVR